MAKISSLSFQSICDALGGAKRFSMHYDQSDALREVSNEDIFEEVRSLLLKFYGDVEIEINPSAYWFDKVKIVDTNWEKEHGKYISAKAAWCDKYGCE